jgi:hypothetical protein
MDEAWNDRINQRLCLGQRKGLLPPVGGKPIWA